MTKIPPDYEELIDGVRAARVEQAARLGRDPREHRDAEHVAPERLAELVELSRGCRRVTEDMGALGRKREKRRALVRHDAECGGLGRWGVGSLAESFSDAEILELLALNVAGHEELAARAERRSERKEVLALAKQVEREREEEARRSAEAEARDRLGVEG